jgi:hypothetical protein
VTHVNNSAEHVENAYDCQSYEVDDLATVDVGDTASHQQTAEPRQLPGWVCSPGGLDSPTSSKGVRR